MNNALDNKLNADKYGSIATTHNGVAEGNTIGANIDALNNTIGSKADLSATNSTLDTSKSIVENLNAIDGRLGNLGFSTANKNLTDSKNVTTALGELDGMLGNIKDLSNTNGNLIADSTVAGNLSNIDTKLGDIKGLSNTKGNLVAASSVAGNLSALDNKLGANTDITNVYNGVTTDGTLKGNINAVNGVIGNQATLSGDNGILNKSQTLVENLNNVDALIGQKSDINAADGGNVTQTTIIGALNDLDNELGHNDDYQTPINGIRADASIKANITAVSNKVGDTSKLADGSSVGDTVSAGTVVGAINQIDDKIGAADEITFDKNNVTGANTIHTNLNNINTALGDTSKLANEKGDTVADATDVSTAVNRLDGKIGKSTEIKHTYNGVSGNNTVHGNIEALNSTIGDITTTGVEGRTVSEQLWKLNDDYHDLRDEVRGGFAATAALAALVPNARSANDTQISIGTGAYRDQVGFAVGAFHYVNDNILLNAGAAYGGSENAMVKAGITFGW